MAKPVSAFDVPLYRSNFAKAICPPESITSADQYEVTALLKEMVQIDSTIEGAWEFELGDFVYNWLEQHCAAAGVQLRRKPVRDGRFNVVAYWPGEIDDPRFVFLTHLDTMPVGEGWTKDPFGAEVVEGKLYGRGALDMKAGFAAALVAFKNAVNSGKKPKHSLVYVATTDEEGTDMIGGQAAVTGGWATPASWVLDTEPSGGVIGAAHKGTYWAEMVFHGKASHGSRPYDGADAVAAMAVAIGHIRTALEQAQYEEGTSPSTVCFGTIQGGINTNIVPDLCTLTMDIRFSPPQSLASIETILDEAVAAGEKVVEGVKGEHKPLTQRNVIPEDKGALLL